jgi:hypothetical protein
VSDLGVAADSYDHGDRLPTPVRVQVAGLPQWEDVRQNVEYETVTAAIEHTLGAFETRYGYGGVRALLRADRSGDVSLFRRDDKTIVVVGQNPLADAVRDALPIDGWHSHPLPHRVTLLSTVRETLGTRTFSLLRREGFTSIEEVTAVPDRGLLDIRNMGSTTIATLRMIAARGCVDTASGPVTLSEYHAAELIMLLRVLLTHLKPQRKDELSKAVSAFIEEAFPAGRPR